MSAGRLGEAREAEEAGDALVAWLGLDRTLAPELTEGSDGRARVEEVLGRYCAPGRSQGGGPLCSGSAEDHARDVHPGVLLEAATFDEGDDAIAAMDWIRNVAVPVLEERRRSAGGRRPASGGGSSRRGRPRRGRRLREGISRAARPRGFRPFRPVRGSKRWVPGGWTGPVGKWSVVTSCFAQLCGGGLRILTILPACRRRIDESFSRAYFSEGGVARARVRRVSR